LSDDETSSTEKNETRGAHEGTASSMGSSAQAQRKKTGAKTASGGGVVRALPVSFATDAGLAQALNEGHPAAAAAAWDRFSPLVRGLLWKTLGPSAEIDDAVQDVFVTLLRRVRALRDPSALTSFVVGITIRTARATLRKRRLLRWLPLGHDEPDIDVALPNVDFASREALRRLYAILDGLPAEMRLAFILRHADGLELTEIAAALECSLATAKRRLSKATERILFHAKRDPVLLEVAGFSTPVESAPRPKTLSFLPQPPSTSNEEASERISSTGRPSAEGGAP
jgi:RNA polymerase sigma-70 factor (ECF subfamily)